MKLIKLTKFNANTEIKEYFLVNPLNITFIKKSQSRTFIYFLDVNSGYIQVWESLDEINKLIEDLDK